MNLSEQLSKHFRETFTGGNWSEVDLSYALNGVDWKMAIQKTGTANSIAMLLGHIHFYVSRVLKVLNSEPLPRGDQENFYHPPINSEEDWTEFKSRVFRDIDAFSASLAQLAPNKFEQIFVDEKYGSYFRNIMGIIEHSYYHIGQIVVLKNMARRLPLDKDE
jgi:hypothetical protein